MDLVIKIVLSLSILVFLISCGVKDYEETGIIIINNGLENNVQMRFFRNSIPSGPEIVSKTGKGEILEGKTRPLL